MEIHYNYGVGNGTYHVMVSYKGKVYEETFAANYPSTFGVDASDAARAENLAEEMAIKIEKEFKL